MYTSGAKQYQQVNVTSEVLDADPHRLIQLLMEASLSRMSQAKGAIERRDMEAKATLLGRVMEIIRTLQSSLNHQEGGEVALNLDRLYNYMNRRLLQAVTQNDQEIVNEVMSLMMQVKEGWDGIRDEYLQGQRRSSGPAAAVSEPRIEGHISA